MDIEYIHQPYDVIDSEYEGALKLDMIDSSEMGERTRGEVLT